MNFDTINIPSLGEYLNQNGYISIDLALDPTGDIIINSDGTIANVSGTLKLIQDIRLFILSPLRTSILDSNWGNPAIDDIGKAPVNNASIEQIINGAVTQLKAFKDNEKVTRGFPLEGSELIGEINDVTILQTGPNYLRVSLTVTDGQHVQQQIDLSLNQ